MLDSQREKLLIVYNFQLEHITRLQSLITNGGAYQAWTSPANLFCGDFGEPFGWDTPMIDSAGQLLKSRATVKDMYHDWASYIGGSQVPYYVPSLNNYYLLSPTTFSADAMCSDTSGLQGLNSFGNSADLKSLTFDGLNYPVYREALSDFVLICPNRLGDSTADATSAGNIRLSDIGILTVAEDLIDRPQLSFVKPMCTVMLHEILHMVTRWDVTTAGTISGQNMIVDHSCEYYPLKSAPLPPPPLPFLLRSASYITNADCTFTCRRYDGLSKYGAQSLDSHPRWKYCDKVRLSEYGKLCPFCFGLVVL
jgi:hypothetical protein